MATYNYGLMEYGYNEETAFEGLMPKVAEKVGVVGASDVVVKMHGMDAKGADALEVMDIQAAYVTSSGSTEEDGGSESGSTSGDTVESDTTVDGE